MVRMCDSTIVWLVFGRICWSHQQMKKQPFSALKREAAGAGPQHESWEARWCAHSHSEHKQGLKWWWAHSLAGKRLDLMSELARVSQLATSSRRVGKRLVVRPQRAEAVERVGVDCSSEKQMAEERQMVRPL